MQKVGVVYKFKPHNKLNGTLFYCFEYYKFLQKFIDVKFYIVGVSSADLQLVNKIFLEKYNFASIDITPISLIELYQLKLDKTLVLDVNTFYECKEFFTGHIHCFSNETHDMFRYKTSREVTYYGRYPYQRFDVDCLLKLNFEIFKPLSNHGNGVFISALNQHFVNHNVERWKREYAGKPIYMKKSHSGVGNIFDLIDTVLYVHTERDTNNRIIPEAFYYGKTVKVEEPWQTMRDSINFRYEDISVNGLGEYTLSESDVMVQACLR